MADITDPQVVLWANQRARTLADQIVQLNTKLTAYITDYAAQGIASKITTDGGANNIDDGSHLPSTLTTIADGRQVITGNSIINMEAALAQLNTAMNTTLVTGVGATVSGVLAGVQVNGSAR